MAVAGARASTAPVPRTTEDRLLDAMHELTVETRRLIAINAEAARDGKQFWNASELGARWGMSARAALDLARAEGFYAGGERGVSPLFDRATVFAMDAKVSPRRG